MYKQKPNGTFRMRASFQVSTQQVEGLNVICRRTGLPFSEVCSKALDITLAHYVKDGQFVYPDHTPILTENSAVAAL